MPGLEQFTQFCANNLALELVNTMWSFPPQVPLRPGLREFLEWLSRSGEGTVCAERLLALPSPSAAEEADLLTRLYRFREALYCLFDPSPAGSNEPLATLNLEYIAIQQRKFLAFEGGLLRECQLDSPWDSPFVIFLESALALLKEAGLKKRVKRCPRCGWFFLDTSKSGRRRWCVMDAGCGNAEKARRHYQRASAKATPGGPIGGA